MHTIEIYREGSFILRIQSPIQYTATYQAAEFFCANRVMIVDSLGAGAVTIIGDTDADPNYTFTYEVTE
jgi:hypothetical protein